ncbi:MAG TPA: glycosyltransferase family 1 protein [Bryobacteraceae bacterium]|nr:glycosyltransferase family 1 protein [Bryobacteraceae bacterium]
MKIGLLIAFAGRACGGPEVYERNIARELSAIAPEHEYHLFCLDKRARETIGEGRGNLVYHVLQPAIRAISLTASLPLAIRRVRPDVLHFPVLPAPYSPMPFLMCMPCTSSIYHPEFYPPLIRWRLLFLFHRAVRRAQRVICVSAHVREAVRERFGVPAERLPVIYPGVNPLFQPLDRAETRRFLEERYGIRYPYFLFSGRWERRKNIVRIIEAFAQFKREYRAEFRLVLSGGRTWAAKEAEEAMARLGVAESVVDLGKTPLDELPYLYNGATALIYASLWEGHGMPISEAQACGVPVITSNVAAMPETAGGAALLIDPYSTESIAAAMHRMATDGALRAELRVHGLNRAPLFSLQRSARSLLELYEEVAGERHARAAMFA